MKITFDKEADAVYIEFFSGNFGSNKKIDDNTILDLDSENNVLGIELLNVSSRISDDFISEISVKNLMG